MGQRTSGDAGVCAGIRVNVTESEGVRVASPLASPKLLLLALLVVLATPLGAQTAPTPEQAEEAVRSWFEERRAEYAAADNLQDFHAAKSKLRVDAVKFCVPAHQRKSTDWICVLEWVSPFVPDGPVAESQLPFRFKAKSKPNPWTVLQSDDLLDPACAPLKVAQQLLREARGEPSLLVEGEVDDGAGLFTTSRVWNSSLEVEMRVMCRYEVAISHRGAGIGDQLEIAYLWFEDGRYRLELRPER